MKKALLALSVFLVILLFFIYQGQSIRNAKKLDPQINTSIESEKKEIVCTGIPTVSLTEGPYYSQGSPEKYNFLEEEVIGEKITVSGFVLDTDCKPIPNAWLDFWQADGEGNYDNIGFKLRGHQFTDSEGKYTLNTVIPGEYPGRTPHIHVKVRANENSEALTSQLFFPGIDQNDSDNIYDKSLLVNMEDKDGARFATFNFILDK